MTQAKPNRMLLRSIVETLQRYAYRFSSEVELHQGIALVLDGAGIAYQREFVAGPRDRFDFLFDSGIVLEAKVKGAFAPALLQCNRYLERPDVSAVVLVATRSWAREVADFQAANSDKQIHVIHLKSAFL